MSLIFLSLEENQPLGICVFTDDGMEHVTLEEFMDESKKDLSKHMRMKYAGAFEIMANQLRNYGPRMGPKNPPQIPNDKPFA